MAEHLDIAQGSKADQYQTLLQQIEGLIGYESDQVANLANVAAAIWQTFGHLWVGFYRVDGEELVLGPFQGPIACTRIRKGKGVCGTAWSQAKTLVVEDVDAFPGHIACSSASKSEIVLPVFNAGNEVELILDIDSDSLAAFDQTDAQYLEQLTKMLGEKLFPNS